MATSIVSWRRAMAAAATSVVLIAALLGSAAESTASDPQPLTLKVAYGGFPDYLDPALSYTAEGWTAMYDTYIPLLTYRHADGRAGSQVVPGLARAMPKIGDGGRTYTLHLRPGLRYSDGAPVLASDFKFSLERAIKLNSGGSVFFADIVGARRMLWTGRGSLMGIRVDDRSGRIVIHLRKSSGTFLEALALPFGALVPRDTPLWDASGDPPPATGPYAIASSRPGVAWTYERNPFWRSTNAARLPNVPGGHVDRISVRVVRNPVAEVRGVLAGRFDWMQNPPPGSLFETLRRRFGGSRFRACPILSTYYFWMNTRRPPFDDLRVRRAVNYAVDRRVIRRIYGGQVAPSQQILPPGMPGYRHFALYSHDLAKARRLMAAADPSDRTVTVWTDAEGENREAGRYYSRQLRRIGLRPRLKVLEAGDYFSVIGSHRTRDLDTGWSNWYADFAHPDDWFRPLLLGSSILPSNNSNFAKVDLPGLDRRIEALSRRPLTARRERGYAALDRDYMKRAPWAPVGTRLLSIFVAKSVDLRGVVWSPLFGADLASFRFR
jgi:peptide/nickel transport system substrate-binding protein